MDNAFDDDTLDSMLEGCNFDEKFKEFQERFERWVRIVSTNSIGAADEWGMDETIRSHSNEYTRADWEQMRLRAAERLLEAALENTRAKRIKPA